MISLNFVTNSPLADIFTASKQNVRCDPFIEYEIS